MQLRFFTLASSLFLVASGAIGQTPSPSPTLPPAGYIRFWDMVPASFGAFELRKVSGPTAAPAVLANAIAYRYSSYVPLPIGQYKIGVFKANDEKTPLKVFDLLLQPDAFYTVLMSPGKIDLVDDTLDPKANTGTIFVRNYFPEVTIAVSAGGKSLNPTLPYGQSFETSGIPPSSASLLFTATLADGTKVQAGVDVDLNENKRATVLIIPDSYGRFRARVTPNGKDF